MPRMRKQIGRHVLTGVKYERGWVFCCNSFPALAAKYAGVDDYGECAAEFERRATGSAEPQPTTEGQS